MKKRRELDALVNGKSGRRKKKGQHELLRNDTDSSDVEEYSIPDKTVVRKRSSAARFCSTCVAVTAFFLLTACVVTIGGLVWVHIDLKHEVDHLRTQLHKVQSGSKGNPDEFHTLHSDLQDVNKRIEDLKTKSDNHHINISDIFRQIGLLNASTQVLKDSIAAAPTLKNLPDNVKEVQGLLMKIGGDVETLKTDTAGMAGIQGFKDDVIQQLNDAKNRIALLEAQPTDDGGEPSASSRDVNSLQLELQTLQRVVDSLNFTISGKMFVMNQDREHRRVHLAELQNTTTSLGNRITELESRITSASDPTNVMDIISQEISKLNITSSGKINSSAMQNIQLRVDRVDETLASLGPQVQQMATLESVANLTRAVDAMSIEMQGDMQDMTEEMGHTTQKVTDLKTRLSQHDVRLAKLEDMSAQTSLSGSISSATPSGQTATPLQKTLTEGATEPPPSNPIQEESTEGVPRDGRQVVPVKESSPSTQLPSSLNIEDRLDQMNTKATPTSIPKDSQTRDVVHKAYSGVQQDGSSIDDKTRSSSTHDSSTGPEGLKQGEAHDVQSSYEKSNSDGSINNNQRSSDASNDEGNQAGTRSRYPAQQTSYNSNPQQAHFRPRNPPSTRGGNQNRQGFQTRDGSRTSSRVKPRTQPNSRRANYPQDGGSVGPQQRGPQQDIWNRNVQPAVPRGPGDWSLSPVPLTTNAPESFDTQDPPTGDVITENTKAPVSDTPDSQDSGETKARSARGSQRTAEEEDQVDSLISALEKSIQ